MGDVEPDDTKETNAQSRVPLGFAKLEKSWPEMTDEEKDAFATALFERMRANKDAAEAAGRERADEVTEQP